MPVIGLPSALECVLSSLLQETSLSSWKVTGNKSDTVIVLRLTGSSDSDIVQTTRPLQYRRKPPSAVRRDNRRAEVRRNLRQREEQNADQESFNLQTNSYPTLFSSPFISEHIDSIPTEIQADEHTAYTPPSSPREVHEAAETDNETSAGGGECGLGAENVEPVP